MSFHPDPCFYFMPDFCSSRSCASSQEDTCWVMAHLLDGVLLWRPSLNNWLLHAEQDLPQCGRTRVWSNLAIQWQNCPQLQWMKASQSLTQTLLRKWRGLHRTHHTCLSRSWAKADKCYMHGSHWTKIGFCPSPLHGLSKSVRHSCFSGPWLYWMRDLKQASLGTHKSICEQQSQDKAVLDILTAPFLSCQSYHFHANKDPRSKSFCCQSWSAEWYGFGGRKLQSWGEETRLLLYLKVPCRFSLFKGLLAGNSVPPCRSTLYEAGASSFFHSSSEWVTCGMLRAWKMISRLAVQKHAMFFHEPYVSTAPAYYYSVLLHSSPCDWSIMQHICIWCSPMI